MSPEFASNVIGALVSGGLDSSIMVGILLERAPRVVPIYVRSGLFWEEAELAAVRRVTRWFDGRVADVVELALPVRDIYGPHWSLSGNDIPDANSPDEAVFLPGRNLLLLVKAGLWCRENGIAALAIGVLDSNPFPDASADFIRTVEKALNAYGPPALTILRPLQGLSKTEIMHRGRDYPLEETFSCIAPVEGTHCGRCNKCAERRRAFLAAGIEDRTVYRQ